MKKVTLWSMLMLAVLMLPMLSGCGDDGDGSSNSGDIKAQLVGIWKTSMSSSNWKYIKLEPNGTLIYAQSINNLQEKIGYASMYNNAFWSYNASDNTISMYTDDGYYAFTYKVNMAADGKSWAGYTTSNNSKTYTFIKVENIDDNDITGNPSGNDDNINTKDTNTYTMGLVIIDKGDLSDAEYTMVNAMIQQAMSQATTTVTATEDQAKAALDAAIKVYQPALESAFKGTGNTKKFTMAFLLKNSSGKVVYQRNVLIDGEKVTIQ